MELYNSLIRDTLAALGPPAPRAWDYRESDCRRDLGSSELVLQKDAAYELGSSGHGSLNCVLFTSSPEFCDCDRVELRGPDLGEIRADTDFARIAILRVGVLDDDSERVYRILKDIEFAKYHVNPEGYMVRISPESCREQVRVSRKALRGGISLHAVGCSYIREYRKDPNVLNARVLFLTGPGYDYPGLLEIAKKASAVTGTLTTILEGLPTDCSVCSLKGICDEVDGMKELHFGVGAKGADRRAP